MLSYRSSIPSAIFATVAIVILGSDPALGQQSSQRIARDRNLFSQIGWTQLSDQAQSESPSIAQSPTNKAIKTGGDFDGTRPNQPLTLAAVEAMALAAHPAIGEAVARVQAAQGRWLQSGLAFNPEIGYSGQQLGSGGQAEQQGIVLAKKFVRGGKLELNRAVECEEIHLRNAKLARQQQRIITDIRIAFYQVLAAGRRLELAGQLNDINSQALKAAESLARAKEGSKVDVLQAQIELETVVATLHQAEFEVISAWRRLATLVGQPDWDV